MSSEEGATASAVGVETPFSTAVSSSPETGRDNETKQEDAVPPPLEPNVTDDDDSSTSLEYSDSEELIDDPKEPTLNGEEALMAATVLKEEGNGHFQTGNWDSAARCYRRGANSLKKVAGPDADPQVTALQLTLQTNLSMVLFKQAKYRHSRDVASKAIKLDANHVKALYRRALANRKMGDFDQAKTDLRAALQVDPNNAACKKELAAIKKQVDTATQQQKSALAKAFSSNSKSSFLYDDKEKEEAEKLIEKERLAKLEVKRKESRKKQWEDECVSRMAKGGQAISFDDWIKEQDEADKKKKKEEEKKRKEAEKLRKKARKATSSASSTSIADDDSDDDELTEQELASLRGYKKTKDGRTTSYFTRELSEEEKQKLADITPKKLDTSTSSAAAPALINADSPTASSSTAAASAWNQAGTWEEKDCTTWCKDSLTEHLQSTSTKTVQITKVEELTGEGSVAITGGKKRYIFDFHAKLKYKIVKAGGAAGSTDESSNSDNKDDEMASGVVLLPDICSTHYDDDELEVHFETSWTKAPAPDKLDVCLETRMQLANELRQNVQKWVQQFNQQF